MYNILICDDEADIVNALKIYLQDSQYQLFTAYNGAEALEIIRRENIHLILLDIMMPELDGIQTLARLREDNNIPVIFLSAKAEDNDIILGLNIGADDYITKPFNPVEVLARVKSQLRRYFHLGDGIGKNNKDIIRAAGVELNNKAKSVSLDGEEVSLTPKEYEIFHFLLRHKGEVFSPQYIFEKLWKEAGFGAENTVAVHIRHLREKLEIDPARPRLIKVVWGQGYKVEDID